MILVTLQARYGAVLSLIDSTRGRHANERYYGRIDAPADGYLMFFAAELDVKTSAAYSPGCSPYILTTSMIDYIASIYFTMRTLCRVAAFTGKFAPRATLMRVAHALPSQGEAAKKGLPPQAESELHIPRISLGCATF